MRKNTWEIYEIAELINQILQGKDNITINGRSEGAINSVKKGIESYFSETKFAETALSKKIKTYLSALDPRFPKSITIPRSYKSD